MNTLYIKGGGRCCWWLRCACAGSYNRICTVGDDGVPGRAINAVNSDSYNYVPLLCNLK
jgi:hypothetical protein